MTRGKYLIDSWVALTRFRPFRDLYITYAFYPLHTGTRYHFTLHSGIRRHPRGPNNESVPLRFRLSSRLSRPPDMTHRKGIHKETRNELDWTTRSDKPREYKRQIVKGGDPGGRRWEGFVEVGDIDSKSVVSSRC